MQQELIMHLCRCVCVCVLKTVCDKVVKIVYVSNKYYYYLHYVYICLFTCLQLDSLVDLHGQFTALVCILSVLI